MSPFKLKFLKAVCEKETSVLQAALSDALRGDRSQTSEDGISFCDAVAMLEKVVQQITSKEV